MVILNFPRPIGTERWAWVMETKLGRLTASNYSPSHIGKDELVWPQCIRTHTRQGTGRDIPPHKEATGSWNLGEVRGWRDSVNLALWSHAVTFGVTTAELHEFFLSASTTSKFYCNPALLSALLCCRFWRCQTCHRWFWAFLNLWAPLLEEESHSTVRGDVPDSLGTPSPCRHMRLCTRCNFCAKIYNEGRLGGSFG